MRTPETEARRRDEEAMKARVAEVDRHLARFVPLARPGSGTARPASATENVTLQTDLRP
jgi:hypothetical protein